MGNMKSRQVTHQLQYKGRKRESTIPVVIDVPKQPTDVGIVLTHGRNGDMDSDHLPQYAEYFRKQGFTCVRFTCTNPYMNYRSNVYQAVFNATQTWPETQHIKRWVLAGRSMGARSVCEVAHRAATGKGTSARAPAVEGRSGDSDDEGEDLGQAGLPPVNPDLQILGGILFSYPLQRQGEPDVRDTPLIHLRLPLIFIHGSRDDFLPHELWKSTLAKMSTQDVEVHVVEGLNHLMNLPRSQADQQQAVNKGYLKFAGAFVRRVAGLPPRQRQPSAAGGRRRAAEAAGGQCAAHESHGSDSSS
mmetsp:Transcript_20956/g.45858  ORF Transcript_20956/g.45858 Transcript_20956/m.45858 type:complete len:302 (+) Transcript_20956:41-946(+)